MVICLERGADLHMAQLIPLSLATVKSRLVLPFRYWLTQVVQEKGPLNGCVWVWVCVCVCVTHALCDCLALLGLRTGFCKCTKKFRTEVPFINSFFCNVNYGNFRHIKITLRKSSVDYPLYYF